MIDVKQMLASSIESSASDVHVNVGLPPIMRIHTELREMEIEMVTVKDAEKMVLDMVGPERFKEFVQKRDLDFSTMLDSGHRFRVNAHYQCETIALSFRAISSEIPELQDLHLPDIVTELTDLPRGLVLVTGHTGSGKSTTLASMVNRINNNKSKRVITLEDPVEYMLSNNMCMIEQREIGSDCPNFESGLRHVLRQDPDIIMVGEMRDLETTSATITGAETGHLVFSTLHTVNASQTIERIIDIYPGDQQNQIRAMLSNTLQAVVSQTLFKRIDEPGMVPCTEILLCNSAVRNCIREGRIFEIPNIIETSRRVGMRSMDFSIAEMHENGYIDRDEAVMRSSNPSKMDKQLAK
jgi:twitching motility protein PilT